MKKFTLNLNLKTDSACFQFYTASFTIKIGKKFSNELDKQFARNTFSKNLTFFAVHCPQIKKFGIVVKLFHTRTDGNQRGIAYQKTSLTHNLKRTQKATFAQTQTQSFSHTQQQSNSSNYAATLFARSKKGANKTSKYNNNKCIVHKYTCLENGGQSPRKAAKRRHF